MNLDENDPRIPPHAQENPDGERSLPDPPAAPGAEEIARYLSSAAGRSRLIQELLAGLAIDVVSRVSLANLLLDPTAVWQAARTPEQGSGDAHGTPNDLKKRVSEELERSFKNLRHSAADRRKSL